MAKLKFHKIAAIVVLVATAGWIATGQFSSVGSAREEAKPAGAEPDRPVVLKTVQVAVPPRVEHARTIHVSGRTEADKNVNLAARVAGIVEELPVEEGSRVKEGDLILRLENEGKEAAVTSAQQTLAHREAEFAAAERLSKSGNLASLQLDVARANLAAARSALEQAKAELDRVSVRAPFDAVVDKIQVEKGTAAMQGAEVATLLKLDPIVAAGEVSERNLGTIKAGDKAEVRLVNGETLSGTIRHVSRAASPQTRTYRFEVVAPNPDNGIPAGMTAEISIKTEMVETVALPRSVITLSNNGELGVRAVDEAAQVHFYPIDIVDDTPEALYLAGIPREMRIIVAGQDLVTDGEKVKAEEADAATIRELASAARPQQEQ